MLLGTFTSGSGLKCKKVSEAPERREAIRRHVRFEERHSRGRGNVNRRHERKAYRERGEKGEG